LNLGDQLVKVLSSSTKNIKKAAMPIQKRSIETAEKISNQMKKSMPEVHKALEIGAKHSLHGAEKLAATVKKNWPVVAATGKKAVESMKHTVEVINSNEQVIAAKKVLKTTASSAGKKVAKETISFVRTLDYDDLVEKGVISESIPFPDTRALHCQFPFFRKANKRCLEGTNTNQFSSNRARGIFSWRKDAISSTKGGWSIPIWQACSGGKCERPVTTSFHSNKQNKPIKMWNDVVSKVIPNECKKSRNDGSVDSECLADFSL